MDDSEKIYRDQMAEVYAKFPNAIPVTQKRYNDISDSTRGKRRDVVLPNGFCGIEVDGVGLLFVDMYSTDDVPQ
jgi:hypothetical protein